MLVQRKAMASLARNWDGNNMKILVACEFSGVVRTAFQSMGHDAVSCDLLSTEIPGQHYQGDVFDIIADGWDMMIAFPPCTHLCVSGARYFAEKQADGRQYEGMSFFMRLATYPGIPKVCIENPVGIMSTHFRKPDQIIQPYEYGHPESKKTCLWLRGLPLLRSTNVLHRPLWVLCPDCEDYWCMKHKKHVADCDCPDIDAFSRRNIYPYIDGGVWDNQCPSGQNKLGPSPTRAMERARTYCGIACAMAEQWSVNPGDAASVSRIGD
jgi:hypothetical protein